MMDLVCIGIIALCASEKSLGNLFLATPFLAHISLCPLPPLTFTTFVSVGGALDRGRIMRSGTRLVYASLALNASSSPLFFLF